MGNGVMPYVIDLDFLSKFYGAEDKELKNELLKLTEPYINQFDEDFEIEDGWLPAKEILHSFLNGESDNLGENTAKCWYIIELIIQCTGKLMNNDQWYPGGDIDFFYGYDEFNIAKIDRLDKIAIRSSDDFPTVFTIDRSDFPQAKNNIVNSDIEASQKTQFEEWIATAQSKNSDLILYCY